MLRQGHFEALEQAFVLLYLRPGDVFVDGGAHIGLYSILAAGAVGSAGKVVAVEPDPDTVGVLRSNLQEHGLDSVHICNAALWKTCDQLAFHRNPRDRCSHNAVDTQTDAESDPDSRLSVQGVTLDAVVRDFKLDRVELAKIDAEGAEPLVLEGAMGAIHAGRLPVLLIEFSEHNLREFGFDTKALIELLRQAGYSIFRLEMESMRLSPVTYEGPIWYENLIATTDLVHVKQRLATAPPDRVRAATDVIERAKASSRLKELQELDTYKQRAAQLGPTKAWAEETEEKLKAAREEVERLRAWAERAEKDLAAARQEAADNRAWAERTEQSLRLARAETDRLDLVVSTAQKSLVVVGRSRVYRLLRKAGIVPDIDS